VLRQPLLDVPLGIVVCLANQSSLDRVLDNDLERRAGLDVDVTAAIEQLLVAVVAQLQPILGIVEREALRNALDGVDQALPGVLDLAQALVLNLDCSVAKDGEGACHLGDLILPVCRRQMHAQVSAGDGPSPS
jgi:hypothetical protein